MNNIIKNYMLMQVHLPKEMSFEIMMFLYVEWKNIMSRYAMIYPGAKILSEKIIKTMTYVLYISDEHIDVGFHHNDSGNHRCISTWQGHISKISIILLSEPDPIINDVLHAFNATIFFSFLKHARHLSYGSYNMQILSNRFMYFKSTNKIQWLKDEIKAPILFCKKPKSAVVREYLKRCPGSNDYSVERFSCPRREKYHMCYGNYFLRILIKMIKNNMQLTLIDDKYVCIFMINDLPHLIVIGVSHIEINNLYFHEKYDYPLARVIFWYLVLRTGMITQQIFMEFYFEKLNKDLLENKFITSDCSGINDMIINFIVDEIDENNKLFVLLLSVLKYGWQRDYKNGRSCMIGPENHKIILKNGKDLYVTYGYAAHIVDMFIDFLEIIKKNDKK